MNKGFSTFQIPKPFLSMTFGTHNVQVNLYCFETLILSVKFDAFSPEFNFTPEMIYFKHKKIFIYFRETPFLPKGKSDHFVYFVLLSSYFKSTFSLKAAKFRDRQFYCLLKIGKTESFDRK